jgi:hypothetical protein
MTIGFVLSYGLMSQLFNIITANGPATDPTDFYVKHFSRSTSGADIETVLKKLLTSIVGAFDVSQLFVYAGMAVLCALRRTPILQRQLALAALVYVLTPMALYAFDRFAPSQPRYYMFAVPLIALSGFIGAKTSSEASGFLISARGLGFILATLVFCARLTTLGFPIENLTAASISSRASFLDFPGVEKTLAANFKDDDIVIINHSLPTVLSRLHNVIYVPPFKQFQEGDNTRISGLIFVYSDTPPNDFFKPKDWIQGDQISKMIVDKRGIVFKQIYAATSNVVNGDGTIRTSCYFYIYKNIGFQNGRAHK